MAVQNTYLIKCDPQIAFDCAIKTLQTFKIEDKLHINQRFLTVTAAFNHYVSTDGLASTKILSVSISPLENGYVKITITGDYRPIKAYNDGNIILTIAEFLDRYSQLLDQLV